MNRKCLLLLFIICLSFSFSVSAQDSASGHKMFPQLSSSSVISMVTVYPGDEIYSLFGHSSFRVYDPVKGIDWMFNYGTFDFDDPMFAPKFVKGKLDYYLSIDRFQSALRFYSEREHRRVVEQVLNFNTKEKEIVYNFLVNNSLPENRYYKYDFIHDNCSTRIADVLIKCFGSSLEFPDGEGEFSYREMIDSYLTNYPALDAGIEIVLGSPADRNPSGIEKFFLPVPMITGFDAAVLKSSGSSKKLVRETLILNSGESSADIINDGFDLSAVNSRKNTEKKSEEKASSTMISGGNDEKSKRISVAAENNPLKINTAGSVSAGKEERVKHPAPPVKIINDFNIVFYLLLIFPMFEIMRLFSSGKRDFLFFRIISSFAEVLFLVFSAAAGMLLSYLWFFSDHIVPNWNFHILWLSPSALLYVFILPLNKKYKAEKYLSEILFASSLLFFLILVSGVQTISYTLLPLYLYSLLLFRRKGHIYEAAAVKKILKVVRPDK